MPHQRTEQAGWEAELFRLLVENSNDYAVFVLDLDGRVLTWNPGAERVLGYKDHEILGQSAFILYTPEDRECGIPEMELQTAIKQGRASDDRWHLRQDGSRLWVSGVMTLLRDESGEARACAKIMRDFTDGKLAADALRESESRLRVALEAAEMGTWLWRIPTDEQILDESLRRLMGLSADEAVMSLDNFLRAVHPEDTERVRAEFERSRSSGDDFLVEFRVRWPDGSLHWLRDQGKVFHDEDGEPLFMTGACVEITARKQYEDELQEADRKKDEFLALLAHELRNPLAPLRNGLQVMRFASDAETVLEVRAMMERQLSHMVRLIDDLLDIARLSQNKVHLQRTRVLLAEAIGNSVESARPAIDAAGLSLQVNLPAQPVFLDADLTRLAQVFSNLLNNSAKYTPRGGHIWLSAQTLENKVEITVRDEGVGIPPEALSRIFDMFAQVDRTIDRATGGLGIGLALVKGLVEMHGGSVGVFSEGADKGSTFTVTLPIDPPRRDQAPSESPVEQVPANLQKRRILVVDDNRDSAKSMAALLRLHGNVVYLAHDGVEAVSAAEQCRPDLILMDVGMPKLNGYGATEQIRVQPWGQQIVIIALTGWGQEDDRKHSQSAGCDGHLVKPVNLSELNALLSRITHGQ